MARDRHGFELRACTRCGGSGRYSYCTMYGDRCFKCGGTGWIHTAKAAKQYAAWRTAWKAACQPTVQQLQVGDFIRDYDADKGAAFQEVTSLVELVDDYSAGWAGKSLRDGEMVVTSWYWMVGLDGAEPKMKSGNLLVRRRATVRAADFHGGVQQQLV
jgi:hypothetical protein